jgi:hypothetical protein
MLDRLVNGWLPALMMALAICALLPPTSKVILKVIGYLLCHYR